jgi:paraquat-inducible protein B
MGQRIPGPFKYERIIYMANRGNKYKVGFLAILFIALLVIALMSLGVWSYFGPKIEFMTATAESVQGLTKGAKVKIKGVEVGQVTNIQIGMKGRFIYIYMELDPAIFVKRSDVKIKASEMKDFFEKNVKKQIREGLRCQLQYEGITGQMYVEIRDFDITKPRFQKRHKILLPVDHPLYIPSVPQTLIGNMLEDAQIAIKKIGEVDFAKISNKLETLLRTSNKLLDTKSIDKIIVEIGDISSNLKNMTDTFNAVINEDKVTAMTNNIKKAVDDFILLSNATRKNLSESNIPETLSTTREMIRNLNILIKYIDMNPDALLKGREGKNIVPPFSKSENK